MRLKTLKRPLSFALACAMLFSSLSGTGMVLAEETEAVSIEETEVGTVAETEAIVIVETESVPAFHSLILPYVEVCGYGYDQSHQTGMNGKDVILGYQQGEEVKLTLIPAVGMEVSELHVYDPQNRDISVSWNREENRLSFSMPEEQLRVALSVTEIPVEITEAVAEETEWEPEAAVTEVETETIVLPEEGETEQLQTAEEVLPEEEPVETTIEEVPAAAEETEQIAETEKVRESESYEIVLEVDGYPAQGSISQVETIEIPYDTWDFDPKTDFTGITYNAEEFELSYLSDDVDYVTPGVYSTIYRMQHKKTDRMWYVLRPVRVCEQGTVRLPMQRLLILKALWMSINAERTASRILQP